MEIIATLTESEVYKDDKDRVITPESDYGALRKTARVALFDEHKYVALQYYSSNGGYFMIGGGIEDGESTEEALRREVKEEVGCNIKNVRELGIILEKGVGKTVKHIQENYCYIADVDGEIGAPQFTEQEIAWGIQPILLELDEAIRRVKNSENNFGRSSTLVLLENAKNIVTT
jgi:8-oxo-dGTP pyrophosphatase MutT (NUDIX family)